MSTSALQLALIYFQRQNPGYDVVAMATLEESQRVETEALSDRLKEIGSISVSDPGCPLDRDEADRWVGSMKRLSQEKKDLESRLSSIVDERARKSGIERRKDTDVAVTSLILRELVALRGELDELKQSGKHAKGSS